MKRRPKPVKRRREKRRLKVHRDRLRAPRHFLLPITAGSPFKLELVLAADRRRMLEAIDWHETRINCPCDMATQGCVRSWHSIAARGKPARIRRGLVVARMFLNRRDLRNAPGELIAHEGGHAAMAWARWKRADLGTMAGEEVMCHSLGHIVQQLANLLPRHVLDLQW